MSLKFRKKPVVIEAFQMTVRMAESSADWPQWLQDACRKGMHEEGSMTRLSQLVTGWANKLFVIMTLEGRHVVCDGDWIIRGVKGELYPCKPDIFSQTYELAEETPNGD